MRDKFTELINAGVAPSHYTNTLPDTPERDPMILFYNKIFGAVSDTHMTKTPQGDIFITGHMINTPKWYQFVCSRNWGAMNFRVSCNQQANNLVEFLSLFNKTIVWPYTLNGDVVAKVEDICDGMCPVCPSCYETVSSKIPQDVKYITTNCDINRVKECYKDSLTLHDVANKFNESYYIKGQEWCVINNHICGKFNDDIIIL